MALEDNYVGKAFSINLGYDFTFGKNVPKTKQHDYLKKVHIVVLIHKYS